jgi:hypothetical protein
MTEKTLVWFVTCEGIEMNYSVGWHLNCLDPLDEALADWLKANKDFKKISDKEFNELTKPDKLVAHIELCSTSAYSLIFSNLKAAEDFSHKEASCISELEEVQKCYYFVIDDEILEEKSIFDIDMVADFTYSDENIIGYFNEESAKKLQNTF